jgi:hypothetical protein
MSEFKVLILIPLKWRCVCAYIRLWQVPALPRFFMLSITMVVMVTRFVGAMTEISGFKYTVVVVRILYLNCENCARSGSASHCCLMVGQLWRDGWTILERLGGRTLEKWVDKPKEMVGLVYKRAAS